MKQLAYLLLFFAFANNTFALNPSKVYKQLPSEYDMKYEEKKVTTKDGATLTAWYFPGNVKTTKLVLIAHNGEGNMADYLRRVDKFTSVGYNAIIFDYRGFGTSSEFKINNDMYMYSQFQADLLAMIEFSRNYAGTFYLYGFGMGAGLSLGIGWHRPEITKIIADSPYLTLEDLEKKFSTAEKKYEVPFAGYDKKHEPIYAMDNAPSKLLGNVMLIVGELDKFMTVEDMKKIQKKSPKIVNNLFVMKGSDGKDNFMFDKALYFTKVVEFMK